MTIFNVGDKVRLTGEMWDGAGYPHVGSVHTIDRVDPGGDARFKHEGTPLWVMGGGWEAELVEEFPREATMDDLNRESGQVEVSVAAPDIPFATKVRMILLDLENLLTEKNESYGNAALDPIRVFSSADSAEQIRVRIDDKLSRLKRGNSYGDEDTIKDLLGYLVLLQIAEGEK